MCAVNFDGECVMKGSDTVVRELYNDICINKYICTSARNWMSLLFVFNLKKE